MKKCILLLVVFFYVNVNALQEVEFDKCVDGDTAWFKINGESLKYRFLAIDTPETLHPTKDGGTLGKTASEYTCSILMNSKKIEIEYDDKSTKTDKYNRELVWVFTDGKLLQEILIEKGYGKVEYIYGEYKYLTLIKEKEGIARNEKVGIWGNIYTVTFNYKNEIYKVDVIEGSSVEPIKLDKKYEKDFMGWFYKEKLFDFNTKITEDIELTGKYKENSVLFSIVVIILFLLFLFIIDKKEFNKQIRMLKKQIFK